MAPRPHHRPGRQARHKPVVFGIPGTPGDSPVPFVDPLDPLGPFGHGVPGLGGGVGGGSVIPGTHIPNPIAPITDIPSSIAKVGDAIQGITNFFTQWLLNPGRLAKLIGGAILLVMGINMAVKQTTGVNVGGAAKRAGEAAAGAAAAAAA